MELNWINRECAFGLSDRGRGGSRLPACILRSSSSVKLRLATYYDARDLCNNPRFTKVGDLQKQWVSVVKRLKRKTVSTGSQACGVSVSLHRFGPTADWLLQPEHDDLL